MLPILSPLEEFSSTFQKYTNKAVEETNDGKLLNCNYVSKIYSDLYFSKKTSLIGLLVSLNNVVQMQNGVLICTINNYNAKHMPLHEEILNKSPVLSLNLHKDLDMSSYSFVFHIPVIKMLNVNTTNARNRSVLQKSYKELCARVSTNTNKNLYAKSRQIQDLNLDEISPVEEQDMTVSLEEAQEKSSSETRVILLEPLLLESLRKDSLEKKLRLEESEYKKSVRIIIMYTFAFCGLAITTFFVIYLA